MMSEPDVIENIYEVVFFLLHSFMWPYKRLATLWPHVMNVMEKEVYGVSISMNIQILMHYNPGSKKIKK